MHQDARQAGDVRQWGRVGADGKPCREIIAYPSTCTRAVQMPYDCSVTTTRDCARATPSTCSVAVKGLCKRTEETAVPCTKSHWAPAGCTHTVQVRYGCTKAVKTAATCGKTVTVKAPCTVNKVLKGGCTKTVQVVGLCKRTVWDPTCCAARSFRCLPRPWASAPNTRLSFFLRAHVSQSSRLE